MVTYSFPGKVVLVTGSSRGMGAAILEAFAKAGATCVLNYFDDPGGQNRRDAEQTAERLKPYRVPVHVLEADVSRYESVQTLMQRVTEAAGGLDILVNNAGLSWGAPSLEYPLDKWQMQIDVNLTGVWIMSQAAAPAMIERGGGRIINVSSITGLAGIEPELQDTVAYNASKGGVNALTRDLAVKWARYNINVNALAPGYFPTRMTQALVNTVEDKMKAIAPMHRLGQEGELKGAVVFLASRAADFITGQVLNVDGGATAW